METMIVSRSRTMHPHAVTPINYWRNCAEGVLWPWYIGSDIWSKMTFEKHLRSVPRAASQRLGILTKTWRVFHDRLLLGKCFRSFVLLALEYCSAVWCSAADTHARLLERVVSGASFLTGVCLSVILLIFDLWHYCVRCIRSGGTQCTLSMVL